ncbi:MAG: glycosyltransferase 87 family protein, partial [Corynebacterium sp.]|nr:glycosyltransferase 87 family protein [Corynebacterium sp.]
MKRIASVPAVWIGWVIARLVLIYLLKINHNPRGDVAYYFAGLFGDDPTQMTEYPHSGTWPTVLLGWLTGENITAFYIGFTIMTLLVDAAFLALLLRHHPTQPRSFQAAWFWVLFGTAAGHTFVWRLDIFPALAVAGAAALLATRPLIASAVLGFATTMKLWPGVLAAGLVGRFNSSATWQRLLAFFCTIVAVCTVTITGSGTERLLSPLNYQGVRGLQLESIPATFLLLQAHRSPGRWHLGYAPSKSFEISG